MASTAALRSNWRTVSSTDNLQAFCQDADGSLVFTQHSSTSKHTGLGMIALACLLLTIELLVLVLKVMPQVSCKPLAAVQQDQYYIYLVPLMVPMVFLAVTSNWFSLKLFKHNS